MSMYGSASVVIGYDDGPGGTLRTITQYVREIGGFTIEAIMARTEAFGDSWEEHTPTGMKKGEPIPVKGFFDDTATSGPHDVFKDPDDGPTDSTRSFSIAFGGGTGTCETRLVKYSVIGKVGNLTEYEALIQPTSTLTWS